MFRNGPTFALCMFLIFAPMLGALPFAHYVLGWR